MSETNTRDSHDWRRHGGHGGLHWWCEVCGICGGDKDEPDRVGVCPGAPQSIAGIATDPPAPDAEAGQCIYCGVWFDGDECDCRGAKHHRRHLHAAPDAETGKDYGMPWTRNNDDPPCAEWLTAKLAHVESVLATRDATIAALEQERDKTIESAERYRGEAAERVHAADTQLAAAKADTAQAIFALQQSESQLAAAKADGERLEWLEANISRLGIAKITGIAEPPATLREAIDAARAAEKGGE